MNLYNRLLTALCCCPLVLAAQTDYPIHFEKTQSITHASRKLNGVTVTSQNGEKQSISTEAAQTAYVDRTEQKITAAAGEELQVDFNFSTAWMHGYVYIDRGRDGQFSAEAANGIIADGSDLMSFSHYKKHNSAGVQVEDNTMNMPRFVVPADLKPGAYRIRFKVDWNSIDPAGALSPKDNTVTGSNGIIANGGVILDASLCIHDAKSRIRLGKGGDLLTTENDEPIAETANFGKSLTVKIHPPVGKKLDVLRIKHGYGLEEAQFVHSTRQWAEDTVPGYLIRKNQFTVPAEMIEGEVELSAEFVNAAPAGSDETIYPLAFPKDLTHSSTATTQLNSLSFAAEQGGNTTISIAAPNRKNIYQDFSANYDKEVSVVPGDRLHITTDLAGAAPLHAYLYIDFDQDGKFSPQLTPEGLPTLSGELVAFSQYNGKNSVGEAVATLSQSLRLPVVKIPSLLPEGVYRARLVFDHNSIAPEGRWILGEEGMRIDLTGGYVTDFLLNVHRPTVELKITTEHGNVYAPVGALPRSVAAFKPLSIRSVPADKGYDLLEYTVKHGHNFDGPQFVNGNRQWDIITRNTTGTWVLPRQAVCGRLHITARFAPGADARYLPLFAEEFNGADGSQPNAKYWKRSQRFPVTWARWISDSKEVVFIENNELVCRAVATPKSEKAKGEKEPMITGAVESRGLFDFQYGKVEGRILTKPHKGNFPAFWMMPSVSVKGWPWEGEIDIWEHIDTQSATVHTIHTNWTYNLGKKNDPPYSHTHQHVDMNRYHTYGIEWTPTTIKWTLDGKVVHTYTKHGSSEALNKGQWPFDRKFYLILNQSVGNGNWAAQADLSHIYETRFDWVRVYQTKEQNPLVGIEEIDLYSKEQQPDETTYDLSGRRVSVPSKGIYIRGGKVVALP